MSMQGALFACRAGGGEGRPGAGVTKEQDLDFRRSARRVTRDVGVPQQAHFAFFQVWRLCVGRDTMAHLSEAFLPQGTSSLAPGSGSFP